MTSIARVGVGWLLVLSALIMGAFELEITPPPWWDEGWTLCVARQWVETGHYGCLLKGQPAPPLLAGHFPVVASIAAGFRLFGIGIWQARLVELLYAFGALSLLYYLTVELYNHKVAVGALVLVLFFPPGWEMHPLILGRQVLGEMPMVCFLLAGFVCLLLVERHRAWWVGVVGCWGLALFTKLQVRPFWMLSLAVPILLSLWRREWGLVKWLGSAAVGSWTVFSLLGWLKVMLLQGHTMAMPPMQGLLQVSAIVLVPMVRLEALVFTVTHLLPTVCGLAYAAGGMVTRWRGQAPIGLIDAVRTMLLTFSLGWYGWFTALSLGGERYAFPLWFLAAPFVAALLCEWSQGYDVRALVTSLGSLIRAGWGGAVRIRQVSVVILIVLIMGMTVQARYDFRGREDGATFYQAVEFLQSRVPADALIETYESELLFLLPGPYHYPPAELDIGIIKRGWEPELTLPYDALAADPDYVVIGEFGRRAGIYKAIVEMGQVRLISQIGRYQIYERVRPSPALSAGGADRRS
ncbi:MAG: hypothetical protein OJF47_002365 [Nitrospira sp.]|jgi:hypothetical protein|nr:MAG: hypothetical protein OJF47_002365 [Nitrospira sp.]